MKGINSALETNPGTSFDTVTSARRGSGHNKITNTEKDQPFPHAIAKALDLSRVSSEVCSAEISSTNF